MNLIAVTVVREFVKGATSFYADTIKPEKLLEIIQDNLNNGTISGNTWKVAEIQLVDNTDEKHPVIHQLARAVINRPLRELPLNTDPAIPQDLVALLRRAAAQLDSYADLDGKSRNGLLAAADRIEASRDQDILNLFKQQKADNG